MYEQNAAAHTVSSDQFHPPASVPLHVSCAQVGGPGGLLKLVVVGATNLGSPKQQQAALADAAAAAAAAASSSTADKTATAADAVSSKISKAAGGSNGTTTSNNVAASAAAKLSSYCEVKFGRAAVLRTPIVHHSAASDCSWNWQFSLALPFELSSWPGAAGGAVGGGVGGGSSNSSHAQQASTSAASRRSSASGVDGVSSDELSLVVYDAQTVGQAVSLGKAKVRMCVCPHGGRVGVDCLVNGDSHSAKLTEVSRLCVCAWVASPTPCWCPC